jgi:hypothetical protein
VTKYLSRLNSSDWSFDYLATNLHTGLILRLVCALCLLGVAQGLSAQIVLREVVATGNGGDVSRATVDAIENAIAQVGGMKISTATSLSMSEISTNSGTKFEENFRQNIEKITRGVVKSYTVLKSGTSPGSGRAFVEIKAVIPQYQTSAQLKRLKLAVVPVSLAGAARSKSEAREFADSVSASLEAFLTQTRKFAMVDRRFTGHSNRELAGANANNSPIEEAVKLGQRVSADYIVLASVREFSAQQQQQQRVTGRVITRTVAPVSVDVRVIDVASGQIKFGHAYTNPGRLPTSVSLAQYAVDIGTDIGQLISTAIHPIAVVGGSDKQLTFNQGGETIQVGRTYRIVSLGKDLIDPHTRESLGQEEREVARAEVVSVTDRTATARIVGGEMPAIIKAGQFFARVAPEEIFSGVSFGVPFAPIPSVGGHSDEGTRPSGGKRKDDDW